MSEVYDRIYGAVAQIPVGRVVTYGQIARHLGLINGGRTVGWAMRRCPEHLPWHRVVNRLGHISARAEGNLNPQRSLLAEEGVPVDPSGRIDLELYGWDGI